MLKPDLKNLKSTPLVSNREQRLLNQKKTRDERKHAARTTVRANMTTVKCGYVTDQKEVQVPDGLDNEMYACFMSEVLDDARDSNPRLFLPAPEHWRHFDKMPPHVQ